MTRGLHDPEQHYYRPLFAAAVRAVEVARSLPEVDPDRVVAAGISQGGGTALAVAGLVRGLAGVMADVPFLCAYRWAVEMTAADPYGADRVPDKEIRVGSANRHEGGGAHQQGEQPAWLSATVG